MELSSPTKRRQPARGSIVGTNTESLGCQKHEDGERSHPEIMHRPEHDPAWARTSSDQTVLETIEEEESDKGKMENG